MRHYSPTSWYDLASPQGIVSNPPDVRRIGQSQVYSPSAPDSYREGMGQATAPKQEDSEWIRYLRSWTDRPNWSVAELARRSRVARSTISYWLSGSVKSITIANVRKIANALGDDPANAVRAAFAVTDVDPRLRGLERKPEVMALLAQLDLNNRANQILMNLDVDDDTLEIMLKRRLEILAARDKQDAKDYEAQEKAMLTLRNRGAA